MKTDNINHNIPPLPQGHRERFFDRFENQKLKKQRKMRLVRYSSVASIMLVLSFSTWLILQNRPTQIIDPAEQIALGENHYKLMFEKRSQDIIDKAEGMGVENQQLAKSVIDQLSHQPIPIEQQLPDMISDQKRKELIDNYYKSKLEGIDRLEGLIAQNN